MQASQFLRIHSVGVTTLNELTCVIESAELGWTAENPTVEALQPAERLAAFNSVGVTPLNEPTRVIESAELGWTAEKPTVEALQSVERLAAFNGHLCQFARWAMAETDARSFGEAVVELIQTGATNEVWESIAWVNLTDLSTQAPHPYAVVDKWVEEMDPRFQTIFRARIPCQADGVTTLEELGGQFGVTRERIRQIEAKLRRRLTRFLVSDAALPVRWRAATLRRMVGVAAPLDVVEHLIKSPPGCNDYSSILLEIAGPYDRDSDWLTLRSRQCDDPTSRILAQVDEVGRIGREFATSQLTEWGLDVSTAREMANPRWLRTSLQWPTH